MRDQRHEDGIEATGRAGPRPRLRAALQAATRDAGARLAQPASGLVLGAGVAIAAFSGPFGTWHDLPPGLRVLYWGLAIAGPGALQTWLSFLVWRLTGWSPLRTGLAAGLAGVWPAWGLMVALEMLLPFSNPMTAAQLLPAVGLPLLAITVLVNLIAPAGPAAPPPLPPTLPPGPDLPPGARFLARLPARLGPEVICVQAQGHYLEVTTTRGRTMILLPISQAEVELAGLPGMRVHRSWWVHLPHVRRVIAQAGRMELELDRPGGVEGLRVPVARTVARPLRQALDRHGPPDLRT